ncbi:MAG: xylulokinase [Clostridiaceae bacterium]
MSYYIGIDLGTSSVKLILVDEIGNIKKTVTKDYTNLSPHPGWREQDPEVWFNNVIIGIKDLLENLDSFAVKGIGVTGQMHTTIFLDDKGDVIRPAILWNDTRTSYLVDDLKSKVDSDDEIKNLKNIISTGSLATNLLWMKENESDNFEKIKTILIAKDYIVYRLTGVLSTDYCDASTSCLFDFKQKQWSERMKDIIGVGDIFPKINSSSDIVGFLKKDISESLGMNADVKVIAGTGDNPASTIASGSIGLDSATISLGTSGVIFVPSEHPNFRGRAKNILFSISNNDVINLLQGTVRSAASCNQWWMENILKTSDFQAEQAKINMDNLGKNKVFFFPHLTGDKLVFSDTSLKGSFIGLGIDTTREQMIQAMLEGVAFALRDVLEVYKSMGITIERAKITGGGTKSDLWIEIISNVLNIILDKLSSSAGPGYGISLLALYGCGEYDSLQSVIDKNVSIEKTICPNSNLTKLYEEKYCVYKKIYPSLKNIFADLK